ncbi:MAG TPA: Nif3-like dinuclear metal center hexameric protein [Syntrophomonadaceae bacterium]|nr:Nif3-like dinuclear metal center hexameric protein [Syntrophomonadaceae bacterium]
MKPKVKDIAHLIEQFFPLELAEKWDNAGLQIGSPESEAEHILVCLDITQSILEKAEADGVNLIITHHPLLFKAVKCLNLDQPSGNMIARLIKKDIAVYSAHTNLDAGTKGLNQLLAESLGLIDIDLLDHTKAEKYFKLVVFIPASHTEAVRRAINEAGAGFTGNYSDCSFRTRGIGTFKPQPGTNPFIGTSGQLEEVDEYRLETIVPQNNLTAVINSMKKVHPYEEVAYDIYPLANQVRAFSLGRKGRLKHPVKLGDFALQVKDKLELDSVRVVGDLERLIYTVAVVSGAGSDYINIARSQDIDLLVTGDLKYHEGRDAEMLGLAVIDAGHQGTEQIVVPYLQTLLADQCKAMDYDIKIEGLKSDNCIKTIV